MILSRHDSVSRLPGRRILYVNSSDGRGGASRIAWDLFQASLASGIDARLLVGRKSTNDARVLVLDNDKHRDPRARSWIRFCHRLGLRPGVARLLGRPLSALSVLKGEEDFDFPGTEHLLSQTGWRPDLLHLHNLHGSYFDLRALPALSRQVPTVVTLHDEWMLTGHCGASIDCGRWETGCGCCPDLRRSPSIRHDATAFNWQRKRTIYQQCHLHLVAPSRALMAKINRSILAQAAASTWVIPHGIDLSIFRPGDRTAARRTLGLPVDAKIVLFSAQGTLDNPYKDFCTLRNALSAIASEAVAQDLLLVALGKEALPERIGHIELRFVPYQEDPRTVARYCQASDIYVHASKAESWGLAVTEAMACGLPVVASAVGGVPDQVEEGVTGFLVEPGNAEQMADRMKRLLSDQNRRSAFSRAAAEVARTNFGLWRMATDYFKLYNHALVGGHYLGVQPST